MSLPPGWVVTETIEVLPIINPSPISSPMFSRRTYICTDADGNYICSSGGESDCYAQAQGIAESRTQQQPYDQAI